MRRPGSCWADGWADRWRIKRDIERRHEAARRRMAGDLDAEAWVPFGHYREFRFRAR